MIIKYIIKKIEINLLYTTMKRNTIKWNEKLISNLLTKRTIAKQKKVWPPNRSFNDELIYTSSCKHKFCWCMNQLAHAVDYKKFNGWKCQNNNKEEHDLTLMIVYNEAIQNQNMKKYEKN